MGTRFRALILAAPLALAACGHSDRLVTRDLTYRSGGRTVEAYLVHRAGTAAARPGVVVVHGSGGDRQELLGREAAGPARGGRRRAHNAVLDDAGRPPDVRPPVARAVARR